MLPMMLNLYVSILGGESPALTTSWHDISAHRGVARRSSVSGR
jgi:hypothetical protein